MDFYLLNSLNKKKEKFIPINKHCIKLYACGPTVYGPIHIGNARSMIVYDILYRSLRYIYDKKHVVFVRNITDIDDKIIDKSLKENITPQALALHNISIFQKDMLFLNCLEPNYQPKVSETLDLIIELIAKLIQSGHAYLNKGNVYFKTSKFKDYFALSGRNAKEARSYVRISHDFDKKNTEDFILWKKAIKTEIGFNSPFGFGRPGWHIECSAMIYKFLGTDIDIHAGGRDLIFPHHSNEIAQSKSLFPESNFVNYWLHSGLLTINGQKMSKSLNNILTIDHIKQQGISATTLRLFFLNTHYSKDLDYNSKSISDIQILLSYWQNAFKNINLEMIKKSQSPLPKDFLEQILSNLNTHNAITVINDKIKQMNKTSSITHKEALAAEVFVAMKFLAIEEIVDNSNSVLTENNIVTIKNLIKLRTQMRIQKNWTQADKIKLELLNQYKVQIEDLDLQNTNWYFLP